MFKFLRHFDWIMFLTVCLILAIGVAFIWSASFVSKPDGQGYRTAGRSIKQVIYAAVGMTAFFCLLRLRYDTIIRYSYPIYIAMMVALVAVLIFGVGRNAARRWFRVGGFSIQPSEFMKVALILGLAKYLRFRKSHRQLLGFFVPVLITAGPIVLILKEPDLGTAMTLLPVMAAMLFVAGAKVRHIFGFAQLGLASAPVLYYFFMGAYQQNRVKAFLYALLGEYAKVVVPSIDIRSINSEAGYHLCQSLTAIGAGGLFGKGYGQGSHHLLQFLPECQTDFIFAVVGEEWGFIGCLFVLFLYFFLLLGCFEVAHRTREPYGRLLVVGGTTLLATQILINIGMTIGLCPITGLTLPFMSYGGSSLLVSFIVLGLIMNVKMKPQVILSSEDFEFSGESGSE